MLGLSTRDEKEELIAFFLDRPPSEVRRLAQCFHDLLIEKGEIVERSWADYEPDGNMRAPGALAASNGK